MQILFVSHQDLEHYERLHPRLKDVLHWMVVFLAKSKAMRITFISIYRHMKDEQAMGRSGIHGLHQATDVVIHKVDGKVFVQEEYDKLALKLTKIFCYNDKGKHEVAMSTSHGTVPHLHLQARDETILRVQFDDGFHQDLF
jgi:hypothetical protein